ncbi:MAG: nitroreductase family protein [Alphaproteobacteria bacterium]|nr:nitroreductase family protein [Alphaproteobacteria bacterium]
MTTARELFCDRFGVEPQFLGDGTVDPRLSAILRRRSHRAFRPEKLPDDLLEALLACAQSAPSKSDLQQYSIIIVDDPDARRAVMGSAPADEWMRTAPHIAVFCADMRRGQRIAAGRGYAHENDSLDTFLNASVDAGLALGFLLCAAEAAGVGCSPISLIRDRIAEVAETLALPPGVYPVAGFCFGWPAREGEVAMRLPPAIILHRERYDDSRLEDELSAYDRRRHERQPIAPHKQRHVARYGRSAEYTWSENAGRQLSVAERPEFRNFLLKHGFALR